MLLEKNLQSSCHSTFLSNLEKAKKKPKPKKPPEL
jgi:hypothetical protein